MRPDRWMMPFLQGKCFDFALALAERVDDPVFVAIGNPRFPDHVALKIGERYADVRGLLETSEFLAHHAGEPIVTIGRQDVELHCGLAGMKPPYRGSSDMREARKAVDRAMRTGLDRAIAEETASAFRP